MATMAIYYGAAKPVKAVGVNQCRILGFAEAYRTWHYMKPDRASKRAYAGLVKRGLIEVESPCYRFKYPHQSATFSVAEQLEQIKAVV